MTSAAASAQVSTQQVLSCTYVCTDGIPCPFCSPVKPGVPVLYCTAVSKTYHQSYLRVAAEVANSIGCAPRLRPVSFLFAAGS